MVATQKGTQARSKLLFYKRPQVLTAGTHGAWRIRLGGLGFAAHAQYVPVVTSEFAEAGLDYPLLFLPGENLPLALLGLQPRNRLVRGEYWRPDAYVPAYVRRYPFSLTPLHTGGIALSIDTEAPHLVKSGQDGEPLFVGDKPGPVLEQAWQFCETFAREAEATEAFVKLLWEQKLLVERELQIDVPNQPQTGLSGFYVVDVAAFAALPDALLGQWHRNGVLPLIYAHLSSLARIRPGSGLTMLGVDSEAAPGTSAAATAAAAAAAAASARRPAR